ncbi:hypothetical protein D3C86_1625460 [compost metagenome]
MHVEWGVSTTHPCGVTDLSGVSSTIAVCVFTTCGWYTTGTCSKAMSTTHEVRCSYYTECTRLVRNTVTITQCSWIIDQPANHDTFSFVSEDTLQVHENTIAEFSSQVFKFTVLTIHYA